MHERLEESQVKQLTDDAENGINSRALANALKGMPFEDKHDALMQIQQANEKNRAANPNLPALTVDLELDDKAKSETVKLRRTCDAFGPKGEPRYSYTHNFGPNQVDVSMHAGNSILCPGNDTASSGGSRGRKGAGLPTPDVEGPEWGGKGQSGGGGKPVPTPDVEGPEWGGKGQSGRGGRAVPRPDVEGPEWGGKGS